MRMKQVLTTIMLLWTAVLLGQEVPYQFSVGSESYEDLVNDTDLTEGMIWDDPFYSFELPFEFTLLNSTGNIFVIDGFSGVGAACGLQGAEGNPYIFPTSLDLIDRAYDFETEMGAGVSSISTSVIGEPGGQIFKIQWKNVGFYSELDLLGSSDDFMNLQLWLHEGSNDISIHYGASSIVHSEESFDGNSGGATTMFDGIDVQEGFPTGTAAYLTGDANLPNLVVTDAEFIDFGDPGIYKVGLPDEGTVYYFTRMVDANIDELIETELTIAPNPATNEIRLAGADALSQESVQILDLSGKVLIEETLQSDQRIDIEELATGMYFLRIPNTGSNKSYSFVKH